MSHAFHQADRVVRPGSLTIGSPASMEKPGELVKVPDLPPVGGMVTASTKASLPGPKVKVGEAGQVNGGGVPVPTRIT